jgi:hypothetical protein
MKGSDRLAWHGSSLTLRSSLWWRHLKVMNLRLLVIPLTLQHALWLQTILKHRICHWSIWVLQHLSLPRIHLLWIRQRSVTAIGVWIAISLDQIATWWIIHWHSSKGILRLQLKTRNVIIQWVIMALIVLKVFLGCLIYIAHLRLD